MKYRTGLCLLSILILLTGCSLLVPMQKPDQTGDELVLWLPGASSVQVLGDWNSWGGLVSAGGVIDPVEGRMERNDEGFWTLDVSHLPAGVYRYAFYVNGHRWMKDGTNPRTASFNGGTVSVLMVED